MPPKPEDVEDEGSDDESQEGLPYNLGFVDEPESHLLLLRHHFPSKVGGRPAWLDPLNLPTRQQLACGVTGKPMQFLLQVYAPLDANPTDAFHRSLLLFISPDGSKIGQPGAVKVLRCQLPRDNPFYGRDPPTQQQTHPRPLTGDDLRSAVLRDPWLVATTEGRTTAGAAAPPSASPAAPPMLPCLELVVEAEADEEGAAGEDAKLVQKSLEAYHARVAEEGEYTEEELPEEVLESVEENLGPERRHFAMFQARIGGAPDQVLRYCSAPGATPLWPSKVNVPTPADIPPCPCCGTPRQFEFQVLPQLLASLELVEEDPACPDWSTLAVYTCPASCTPPPDKRARAEGAEGGKGGHESAYVEEFVWAQRDC